EYYLKLPSDVSERMFIVLDPMLATGGSADDAIASLKKHGAKSIKLMCLVGAKEGVDRIQQNHTDVDVYLSALDEEWNEHGYIVPGLGDAGDRLFGTKKWRLKGGKVMQRTRVLCECGTRPEAVKMAPLIK